MHGNLHIPKVPGPKIPQTILIIIIWVWVVWIIIWDNWICLCTIGNTREIAYPKEPRDAGPPKPLINIFCDLVAWILIWKNLICLFTIGNTKKIYIYIPKCPGTPGPPNHIKYYILGLGGLDYHLGELNLFAYFWNTKKNVYPKAPGTRDPEP